jgi:hypothetical protein
MKDTISSPSWLASQTVQPVTTIRRAGTMPHVKCAASNIILTHNGSEWCYHRQVCKDSITPYPGPDCLSGPAEPDPGLSAGPGSNASLLLQQH